MLAPWSASWAAANRTCACPGRAAARSTCRAANWTWGAATAAPAPAALGKLEVVNGSTLTGTAGATVSGLFTWAGGNLSGTGRLTAQGGMSISSNNTTSASVVNSATATWTSGTIYFSGDGTFTNT